MLRPTILIPVDFEGSPERALEVARQLGDMFGADLVLLHAYALPVFYPDMPSALIPRLCDEVAAAARSSLTRLAAGLGGLESVLRQGDPASEIVRVIGALEPVMVVMRTHGRRGLARVAFGSVVERVVRSSPVPVVTVADAA